MTNNTNNNDNIICYPRLIIAGTTGDLVGFCDDKNYVL